MGAYFRYKKIKKLDHQQCKNSSETNRLNIGPYTAKNNLFLAPMAGVTDLPFRKLCRKFGAGWVVSEMIWSQPHLLKTTKTMNRITHGEEPSPKIVQIAGGDAAMIAETAILNVDRGAEIIDINMGCPAKKVCNKLAGSALMKDEKLVSEILNAVVNAVNVPVTLKIRTGWNNEIKNALTIAKIAEEAGIQMLAVHGRTRDQKYTGLAEHDTVAKIKQAIKIPVIANGDVSDPEQAKAILNHTQADGLMIGRAAQGNPWIFEQIDHYLKTGNKIDAPNKEIISSTLINHINELHLFYGEHMGSRIARKHVGWYIDANLHQPQIKKEFNKIVLAPEQINFLESRLLAAMD
ncbi:MAG: tRNA-dihydrouridine synthase B [Francisellaceae bacterium]